MTQIETDRLGRRYSVPTTPIGAVLNSVVADLGGVGLVLDGTISRVAFQIDNIGANPLSNFEIHAQMAPEEPFFVLIGVLDWKKPSTLHVLIHTDQDLAKLSTGDTGIAVIDVGCLYAIDVLAESMLGTNLTLKGIARGFG